MGLLESLIRPRASENLGSPDSWVLRAIGGGPTTSGVQISESTATTIAAVYACIRILAGSVGQLPLDVFERTDDGKRLATEHPSYWMLKRRPNPWMSAFVHRRAMMGHAVAWGNGYSEIIRNGHGQAVQLRLMLPDRTRPEAKAGAVVYRSIDAESKPIELVAEDVLHLTGLGYDGLRGYSPISLHREALGLAKATEQFGAAWFGNGSSGGGLLELPGDVSPDARKKILAEWQEENSGRDRWGKVKSIPAGAKYTALSIPPEDAQFLQTREFQIAEIARIFGVPLHMLESHAKSTSWGSGIEQFSIGFVRYTLGEWIVMLEQELDRKLFLGEEQDRYYVKLNLRALLRGSAKEQAEFYRSGIETGWFMRSEAREFEDLDPIDGLEEPLVPKAQAAPAETAPTTEPKEEEDE